MTEPKRQLIKFNHYEGEYFSVRVGGGFVEDGATFIQDEASKEQFDMGPNVKLRISERFSKEGLVLRK